MSRQAPGSGALSARERRRKGLDPEPPKIARPVDADKRSAERIATPVTIRGVKFKRRLKDWDVSDVMRALMRRQEKAVARAQRLAVRVGELEAEQIEAAATGDDEREAALEKTIDELLKAADSATREGERTTYRLCVLLLEPPDAPEDGYPETAGDLADRLEAFGALEVGTLDEDPLELPDAPAVEWLKPLDSDDVLAITRELAGTAEPDPQTPQSSPSAGND